MFPIPISPPLDSSGTSAACFFQGGRRLRLTHRHTPFARLTRLPSSLPISAAPSFRASTLNNPRARAPTTAVASAQAAAPGSWRCTTRSQALRQISAPYGGAPNPALRWRRWALQSLGCRHRPPSASSFELLPPLPPSPHALARHLLHELVAAGPLEHEYVVDDAVDLDVQRVVRVRDGLEGGVHCRQAGRRERGRQSGRGRRERGSE